MATTAVGDKSKTFPFWFLLLDRICWLLGDSPLSPGGPDGPGCPSLPGGPGHVTGKRHWVDFQRSISLAEPLAPVQLMVHP